MLRKLSSPLQAINKVVPVVEQQTEDITVRVSSPQDDARNLREDISILQKKGSEDFANLDQPTDKGTEKIENALAKMLNKYSADMDRVLAIQNFEFGKSRTESEALVVKHYNKTETPAHSSIEPVNKKAFKLGSSVSPAFCVLSAKNMTNS